MMFLHPLILVAFALDNDSPPLRLPTFGELIFKTVVALGIVVGLLLLFFWYVRGFVRKGSGGELVKVVDRVYLDGRRFLCLVKVGDRYFLLGVGDGGVNFIAEFDKVIAAEGEEIGFKSSFRKQLERFIGKKE